MSFTWVLKDEALEKKTELGFWAKHGSSGGQTRSFEEGTRAFEGAKRKMVAMAWRGGGEEKRSGSSSQSGK